MEWRKIEIDMTRVELLVKLVQAIRDNIIIGKFIDGKDSADIILPPFRIEGTSESDQIKLIFQDRNTSIIDIVDDGMFFWTDEGKAETEIMTTIREVLENVSVRTIGYKDEKNINNILAGLKLLNYIGAELGEYFKQPELESDGFDEVSLLTENLESGKSIRIRITDENNVAVFNISDDKLIANNIKSDRVIDYLLLEVLK